MKKSIWLAVFVSLLMPILAMAQSSFNGTWKIEVKSAKLPDKPDVFLLQGGVYQCKSCAPPTEVKADGQSHPVTGYPTMDAMSVTVVDDRTIVKTFMKAGKTVGTTKVTVAPGGESLSYEFSDSSASTTPVTGKGEETRVAKGPAGSHAISGSWRMTKLEDLSDNALLVTYKLEGDSLTMSSPSGQSYTAKLDGTDAPYKGDPGTTSVSVKRLGKNSIEETDKRDGKVIGVSRMTVAADGKTMTMAWEDKLLGSSGEWTAKKQ